MCIFIISIFGIHSIKHQELKDKNNQIRQLKILPDNIKFNGNEYSGKAFDVNDNQEIAFFGILNNDQQLKDLQSLSKASQWDVVTDIKHIDNSTNVNQFNSKMYYFSEHITNSLTIKKINNIQINYKFNINNIIHNFRKKLLNYAYTLPHPLDTYIASLFLGFMDSNVNDELIGIKQLGLIHLFSISGLHVQLFLSVVSGILIRLRLRREYYQVLLIIILPFYFIFAGSSTGLLRAILTAELSIIFKYFHKKISGLDIWSITLIINLFIDPLMIIQFGCQLSYALSFGLIFTSKFNFIKQTICMNLIGLPIIIFHLYEWDILSLLANLLILPFFSIAIFPLALIGALSFNYISSISYFISNCLKLFDDLINFIGSLPGNIIFGKPNLILCFILFILSLYLISNPNIKRLLILLTMYLIIFIFIHFPLKGEISCFDVGQGDSFLIREPFNRSVTIIDTGGKLQFNNKVKHKFQAERVSINYLKSIGVTKVDNLCLSHQDSDHTGDVPAFLQEMKVKQLLIPIGMDKNNNFMNKIKPYLKDTKLISVKNNDNVNKLPLHIYHPFESGMGENHDSMVLGGQFGGNKWLFMGDLDQAGELDIINKYPNLSVDVLKLGHHGSDTSTSPLFLQKICPKIAIISAGRNNKYGHPKYSVVQLILNNKIKIFNTQNDGMITYHYYNNSGKWSTKLGSDEQ